MESPSLLLPRFTPTPTRVSTRTSSPLLPRSSLRLRAPPRHIRLFASSSGGSNATADGDGEESESESESDSDSESETETETDLLAVLGKVFEAYRNSNRDVPTFFRNLVEAGVVDESDILEDDLLRRIIDADPPVRERDTGVPWKLLALAVFSFAGVPTLLGYLGDAAGAHVPAWMPLVYSLTSFLLGSLLVVDTSVSDEELTRRREQVRQELAFLDSEAVLWRMVRRVPTAALAASAAGEAALRAAAAVTGLDLVPPLWVAFLLFGVFLGVPYGLLSASLDPAVEGSFLGWEEFVRNIRDLVVLPVLQLRDGQGRGKRNK